MVEQYLKDHGGKIKTEVQTRAASPPVILYKVMLEYKRCFSMGNSDHPMYRYTLADGGTIFVQFLRGYGSVPGHPNQYWTTIYVWREENGQAKRKETG